MTMRDALISFPMFGEDFVINPPASLNALLERLGVSPLPFDIYFYGLIIAMGFLLAVAYTAKFHDRLDISMDDVYDLVIFALPSAIVGARLYYVIFNFSLYTDDLMGIFRIRDGGLAIYGGVIGAVVALVLRCRHKKIPLGKALDVAAFGLLIGQCVGRWGNFFNREAFGYETDVFCRMGLTLPGRETVYYHPTFLYESLWNLLGLLILHFLCKKRRKYQGQFFILYVAWYGLGRAWIEGLRTDSLWLIPDVIRVSQLLAVVSCAAAVCVYVLNARRLRQGRGPLLGGAIDGHDTMEAGEEINEQSPDGASGGEDNHS